MADKRLSNLQREETFGCKPINPKYCKTCRFSRGKPPFEDSPEKIYCMIYSREDGDQKPHEVYYEGQPCEHYHKDEKH